MTAERDELIERARKDAEWLDRCATNGEQSEPQFAVTAANIRDLLAALEAQPQVPQGWKPVPAKPTEKMIAAFVKEQGGSLLVNVVSAYRAMLAAAPPTDKEEVKC